VKKSAEVKLYVCYKRIATYRALVRILKHTAIGWLGEEPAYFRRSVAHNVPYGAIHEVFEIMLHEQPVRGHRILKKIRGNLVPRHENVDFDAVPNSITVRCV
jgi:hypothetical protein